MNSGIYARISLDVAGDALGVARQVEDCTAKATALGWAISDVYVDNDVSASKNVRRPEYERMLSDLESGRISAVVVYDLDRLTRKPAELEAFIDLTDRLRVSLANVAGDVDLTTAAGRMVARIKGAVARQEAERIGERVKRQKQQRLSRGLPPGSRYRTYGYTRDWQLIEAECVVVRDIFRRVVAGESVNSVTNDLIKTGAQTVSGQPWRYQVTSRILASSIYAGLLSHGGEVVGKSAVPAIVSEAEYAAAQRRQSAPAWNTRKHLLSGIAVCDLCKTPMNHDGKGYVCSRMAGGCGRVRIQSAPLDAVVHAYMASMVMLQGDEVAPGLESGAGGSAETAVAELDRQIEQARAAQLSGELAFEDMLPLLKELRVRRQRAMSEASRLLERAVQWQPLIDYDNADISLQRTQVRRFITALMVKPAVRGRTAFDEDRLYVHLTDGSVHHIAAINVVDYREHVPGYPLTHPLAERT